MRIDKTKFNLAHGIWMGNSHDAQEHEADTDPVTSQSRHYVSIFRLKNNDYIHIVLDGG